MHQTERLAALRRVPVLAELPQTRLEHLAGTCKWRDYAPGEQIFSLHDRSTDVLFLAAGKVRVIIYSSEGKAVLFTLAAAPLHCSALWVQDITTGVHKSSPIPAGATNISLVVSEWWGFGYSTIFNEEQYHGGSSKDLLRK